MSVVTTIDSTDSFGVSGTVKNVDNINKFGDINHFMLANTKKRRQIQKIVLLLILYLSNWKMCSIKNIVYS